MIVAWLPTIFQSDLQWFDDSLDGDVLRADLQREEVMDLAAKRIAERCGRSATSDITRTWTIPKDLIPGSCEDLQITLHEPGLTEGNTGHKTWGAAFALIKELVMYKTNSKFFRHIFQPASTTRRILELGSGTGLFGIAAAAIWSCPILLTDLEVIVPNLKRNMEHNIEIVHNRGGDFQAASLDWASANNPVSGAFEIILASDPIYDDEQVDWLANTIDKYLDLNSEARALVAVPLRDHFSEKLAKSFQQAMELRGFVLVSHGLVLARDDFGDGHAEVTIQRDLFGRKTKKFTSI